jgi:hypothetical protein
MFTVVVNTFFRMRPAVRRAIRKSQDSMRAARRPYIFEKKELDAAAKKEILGLLFKKFIIKNAAKNAAVDCRIVPFWYSPFDKMILEEENAINVKRKGKIAPILYQNLRMATWAEVYHKLKLILDLIYKNRT